MENRSICFRIASASRPQPQTSDRRQIDDMNSTSISRSSSMTNTAAAASNQRASSSNLPADGFGPLPPGWQMSKNESGRVFFIDHINKRTTWVCYRIFCKRKTRRKLFVFRSILEQAKRQFHLLLRTISVNMVHYP